jgi:hypothetical protein
MPITEPQASLRRQLADNLRADSDAIQDHLKLAAYLGSGSGDGSLWTDTYVFPTRDIKIEIDQDSSRHQDANRGLIHALELMIQTRLPAMCREVLEMAAKRADIAIARFTETAPPDDASTLSKVLGNTVPVVDA